MCAVHGNTKRSSKKLEEKEIITTSKDVSSDGSTTGSPRAGLPKNAIIAIEVVDPSENTTKEGKGRKRTIESALGYGYNGGYQNFFDVKPKPPKYEVYKYSQQDIPAYKGSVKHVPVETYPDTYQNYNSHAHGSSEHAGPTGATSYSQHESHGGGSPDAPNYEIQKSVQYDLGSTAPAYEQRAPKKGANLQQYYQNGATLFSSLDHNGQLSSLSSQVPSNHGPMVPVIILRVYTNQLGQNALHANIPQGHPYANLNSVDLQSLLAGYVQNNPHQQGAQQYYDPGPQTSHSPQVEQEYYQPAPQGPTHAHYSNQPQTQSHSHHQHQHQHHDTGLLTNENYPDDAHTKVIFKKPATGGKTKSKHSRPPQKFKITIPENTYSKVEVQEHTYGGPHDGGQYVQQHVQYAQPQVAQQYEQQYYYQQQPEQYDQYQQQPQHPSAHSQQEYQSSIQSLVQYQQVPQEVQKHVQGGGGKHARPVQPVPSEYVQYGPPQQQQQQQPQQEQQPQQHYDAKQYVQIATYPSNVDPEQHQAQQQQQQQQHQGTPIPEEYYQQYLQYAQQQAQQQAQTPTHAQVDPSGQHGYQNPAGTEAQYVQRPEPGAENQEFAIVKHSNDAGRDLHPKLFNYHAHGAPEQQRGTPKKKRERKQRKNRVPLVLAPDVMETLEKKQ